MGGREQQLAVVRPIIYIIMISHLTTWSFTWAWAIKTSVIMQIMQIHPEAKQGGRRSHKSKHVPCKHVCTYVCVCVCVCVTGWTLHIWQFTDLLIGFFSCSPQNIYISKPPPTRCMLQFALWDKEAGLKESNLNTMSVSGVYCVVAQHGESN